MSYPAATQVTGTTQQIASMEPSPAYDYNQHDEKMANPNQIPAQIPQQQQQQQQPKNQVYALATPLYALAKAASPVDCPVCGVRAMTRPEYVSGGATHLSAAACCFFFCLGCIPYCVKGLKDVEHRCGNCNAHLATWHRSGRTEVQQAGAVVG